MIRFAALVAVAVWASPCFAQQPNRDTPTGQRTHLVPVDPAYAWSASDFSYPKTITTVFREAYAKDVRARVYVTAGGPGPLLSDMLYLRQVGSDYHLVYLHPPVWLFNYLAKPPAMHGRKPPENDPADYRDLKPWRCERIISGQLGSRIIELWKLVLLETRYEMRWDRGFDGADYEFSMEVSYEGSMDSDFRQELAGKIWSPDEDTKPGMLVGIVDALSAQCLPELYGDPEPLEPLIEKLEKKFGNVAVPHDVAPNTRTE